MTREGEGDRIATLFPRGNEEAENITPKTFEKKLKKPLDKRGEDVVE